MAFYDLESEIEDAIEDILNIGGAEQLFSTTRFYATTSDASLVEYIQSKVKQIPTVFLRVTGDTPDMLDTIGQLHSVVYTVEVIVATPNHGRIRQIKGEKRKVNTVKNAVLNRLIGQSLTLTDQAEAYLTYLGSSDLFTDEVLDVRLITLQVQGIVLDFN